MIVDLRRLEEDGDSRGSLEVHETVTVTDAFGEERVVDGRIVLSYDRSGGAFFFHGELAGEFQTKCHMCLEDVSYPVTGDFDVVVRKGSDRDADRDVEEDQAKDIVTLSLNEHEVSLDQYINENLIVNVPMRILCKEDCNGLCPQCGINRNHSTCDCSDTVDPRWDALRKLKND